MYARWYERSAFCGHGRPRARCAIPSLGRGRRAAGPAHRKVRLRGRPGGRDAGVSSLPCLVARVALDSSSFLVAHFWGGRVYGAGAGSADRAIGRFNPPAGRPDVRTDGRTSSGQTALHKAAFGDHIEAARVLLGLSPSPPTPPLPGPGLEPPPPSMPAAGAVDAGAAAATAAVGGAGAPAAVLAVAAADAVDSEGRSALHVAAAGGAVRVAELLSHLPSVDAAALDATGRVRMAPVLAGQAVGRTARLVVGGCCFQLVAGPACGGRALQFEATGRQSQSL